MQYVEIQGEQRPKTGTGPARAARREGKLPGILYGTGLEPTPVAVKRVDIDKILRTKLGRNTLIQLNVAGSGDHKVMIKDFQGEVISRQLTHIDFWVVKENQEIEVNVPIHVTGKAIGSTKGGIIDQASHSIHLFCQVGRIPEEITVDISSLDLGENLHLSDIKLPEGTRAREKYNPTLVAVVTVREEAAAAPAAADAAAPAAGAAPAADAKAGDAKAPAADAKKK